MSSGGVCFKVLGAVSVLGLLVLCFGRWGWVVVLVWGLVGLGVESSAFLKGDGKDQIEVTGHGNDGIDAAKLTKLLRKKFGYAILESVSAAASDGEGGEPKVEVVSWPSCRATVPLYYPDVHYVMRSRDPTSAAGGHGWRTAALDDDGDRSELVRLVDKSGSA
ncbi:hypothetical protein Q3G72_016426 [Acer saccharum]|nr:hypothetical protein Q3G72_016813 [Acer saccharum]KAK1557029.1 hypothetical protein Q3G72_016426 [Acer saccharum]